MTEPTFWNGEPTPARKVWAVVADSEAPLYWARDLVGTRREAVEVVYGDATFYIDDGAREEREVSVWGDDAMPVMIGPVAAGSGWRKVTVGHGSPRLGHGSLNVEPGSVEDRA